MKKHRLGPKSLLRPAMRNRHILRLQARLEHMGYEIYPTREYEYWMYSLNGEPSNKAKFEFRVDLLKHLQKLNGIPYALIAE